MYTIKEASARSGVGVPLIRAWERRYGVVKPDRATSGYRMYDEGSIRILRAMRSLVDSGWTASEAARAIGSGEVSVDDLLGAPAATPADVRWADGADDHARLIARFLSAAESASAADTEASLDEILASGSFEAIVDDVLLPAIAALGDLWSAGRLSTAGEHAASAAGTRRLAAAYQAAGVPGRSSVVVGLPPGSRHELGALAFAVALRRRGVGVFYIGTDVTIDGWVDAVRRTQASAAVVGVVTPSDREAAAVVTRALRAEGVALIAVGGAAAGTLGDDGVLVLPARVTDAAAVVANAVGPV
jgi:DNA-binding transcriptional MerR regulator/methylmalonyl-CoA mutase cobalamin-binding subunit